MIYPQGTRVPCDSTVQDYPYKPGVFRIHEQVDIPVIPLATNSGYFWPKGRMLKKSGTVVFEFLPPMSSDLDRSKFMEQLETQIEGHSRALVNEASTSA